MQFCVRFTLLTLLAARVAVADETLRHDVYTIEMKSPDGTTRYPFMCIEGAPYFQLGRKRLSSDRPTRWHWKSFKECDYFELSMRGSDVSTTIRNLGPGGLNDNGGAHFAMRSIPGDEKSLPGYLTADYSTDPPSVKLEKAPGKASNWLLHAKGESEYYIENLTESGKHAWLAYSSKSTAVIPIGDFDSKEVADYRAAVLSYDFKATFLIKGQIDESDR